MLRRDVKYMLETDWEPSVPSQEVVLKQSELVRKHGIYTNLRFYLGLVKCSKNTKKKQYIRNN